MTAQQVEGYFGDKATKVVAGSNPAALSAVFSRSTPGDCGSKAEAYFAHRNSWLRTKKPPQGGMIVSPISSTVLSG